MDALRYNGASFDVVKRWFDAIAERLTSCAHNEQTPCELCACKPHNRWNMDESGFGIGESQGTKVLVPVDYNQTSKMVAGNQEWVTDIECINAAGQALDPMIIWKAKNINSGWIPPDTPTTWHFGCSENGWTSNEMGLAWLKQVFEPQSRAIAIKGEPSTNSNTTIPRRMLIADGHGSHIRADFIAYCMENNIDLLIMPPHCSHLLQPLVVGVFAAFKRAHASETDAVSMLSTQRIHRAEWLQMFQRARTKAVTSSNILAGWRGAGLYPSDPKKVLDRLPSKPPPAKRPRGTPPDQITLDFSLLKSSPPSGTELRESNIKLDAVLAQTPGIPESAKRYISRVTRMAETQNATIALQARQIEDQKELLNTRKNHKRGKRVRLKGFTVYSTEKVLEIAREEEKKKKIADLKEPRGRPRKRPIKEIEVEEEDEAFNMSSSESDVIVVQSVGRGTRSRKVDWVD